MLLHYKNVVIIELVPSLDICYTEPMIVGNFNIIDLFSGAGGSALGFRKAGFSIKAAVEINSLAAETFKANFPEATVFTKDIREIKGKDLLGVSGLKNGKEVILLACPPCQGFSSARRVSQRLNDPRNMLIREFLRLVGEIKPSFFVMENVPGLARGIGKPLFDETLEELRRLGYLNIAHGIVDVADYGVPQHRKRLLLIGTRLPGLTITLPKPTNQDPDHLPSYLPPWKTVKEAIGDLKPVKAGGMDGNDKMHVAANLSELNMTRMRATPKNGGSRTAWPEDLVLECHKKVTGYKDIYGRMKWNAPSPAITGGCAMISKGRYGHPDQNRAITLREAARLQTFTDEFLFFGTFGEIAKQIGNAVPSLLTTRIANMIKRVMKTYNGTVSKEGSVLCGS